jgi:hypothetical protein
MKLLLCAFILIYSYGALSTLAWIMTGHCCGIYLPFITDNRDNCLPVQNRMWPYEYLAGGHCDEQTWKRVN